MLCTFSWVNPDGNRNVAYLNGNAANRKLNLNSWSNRWNGNWWFLAFRYYLRFPPSGGFYFIALIQPPSIFPSIEF